MSKKSTQNDVTSGDNHGLSNATRLEEDGFGKRGKGEVYSYTVMHDAPTGFDETTPYAVALVKLEVGPVVTAQLTDLGEEQPHIGMPVEMVTRKIREDGNERGMQVYGYKFRPVLQRN